MYKDLIKEATLLTEDEIENEKYAREYIKKELEFNKYDPVLKTFKEKSSFSTVSLITNLIKIYKTSNNISKIGLVLITTGISIIEALSVASYKVKELSKNKAKAVESYIVSDIYEKVLKEFKIAENEVIEEAPNLAFGIRIITSIRSFLRNLSKNLISMYFGKTKLLYLFSTFGLCIAACFLCMAGSFFIKKETWQEYSKHIDMLLSKSIVPRIKTKTISDKKDVIKLCLNIMWNFGVDFLKALPKSLAVTYKAFILMIKTIPQKLQSVINNFDFEVEEESSFDKNEDEKKRKELGEKILVKYNQEKPKSKNVSASKLNVNTSEIIGDSILYASYRIDSGSVLKENAFDNGILGKLFKFVLYPLKFIGTIFLVGIFLILSSTIGTAIYTWIKNSFGAQSQSINKAKEELFERVETENERIAYAEIKQYVEDIENVSSKEELDKIIDKIRDKEIRDMTKTVISTGKLENDVIDKIKKYSEKFKEKEEVFRNLKTMLTKISSLYKQKESETEK